MAKKSKNPPPDPRVAAFTAGWHVNAIGFHLRQAAALIGPKPTNLVAEQGKHYDAGMRLIENLRRSVGSLNLSDPQRVDREIERSLAAVAESFNNEFADLARDVAELEQMSIGQGCDPIDWGGRLADCVEGFVGPSLGAIRKAIRDGLPAESQQVFDLGERLDEAVRRPDIVNKMVLLGGWPLIPFVVEKADDYMEGAAAEEVTEFDWSADSLAAAEQAPEEEHLVQRCFNPATVAPSHLWFDRFMAAYRKCYLTKPVAAVDKLKRACKDRSLTPRMLADSIDGIRGLIEQQIAGGVQSVNDERDAWMYEQHQRGKIIKAIRKSLEKESQKKSDWEQIETDQGVRQAIQRYAKRKGLPTPRRKGGRPPKKTRPKARRLDPDSE